jgi:outer membrane protein
MIMKYLRLVVGALALLCSSLGASAQWSLDSCISYAYHHNLSIKQSDINVELAETRKLTSVGAFLPTLNGSASHGYNWGQRIDPFTNQFASQRIQSNSFGLQASITLFNGFQNYNSLLQADLNTETNKWNYERMRNDIALNVASGYLTMLLNAEFVIIAEGNVRNTEKQVSRLEKLVAVGQVAEGQLNEMKSQLATNQANLVNAQNNYSLSRLSLMQLLTLSEEEMRTFSIVVPSLNEIDQKQTLLSPEVIAASAVRNFPQMRGAETNLASAVLGEKIARGNYYPRLSASYTYGTGYSGAAKVLVGQPDSVFVPLGVVQVGEIEQMISLKQPVFNNDDYKVKPFNSQWHDNVNRSLFFTVTVPIVNGFNTTASVKQAKLNRKLAELQVDQTKQELEQSVQRAWADAQAAFSSYEASKASTEASTKAFQWSEVRFEQGVINPVDFADAQNRLLTAKANETRSKFDYFFKLKVLDFYLGKPLSLK